MKPITSMIIVAIVTPLFYRHQVTHTLTHGKNRFHCYYRVSYATWPRYSAVRLSYAVNETQWFKDKTAGYGKYNNGKKPRRSCRTQMWRGHKWRANSPGSTNFPLVHVPLLDQRWSFDTKILATKCDVLWSSTEERATDISRQPWWRCTLW